MRVYISGPMSGRAEYNYPLFNDVAEWLAEQWPDAHIDNPATHDDGQGPPQSSDNQVSEQRWQQYLRKDVKLIADGDAIVMLPEWATSRGATFELYVARTLGLMIFQVRPDAEKRYVVTLVSGGG
jgi:hypothetical protein